MATELDGDKEEEVDGDGDCALLSFTLWRVRPEGSMGILLFWLFLYDGLFPQTELLKNQIEDVLGGGNADNGIKLGQTFLEVDSQQVAGGSGL